MVIFGGLDWTRTGVTGGVGPVQLRAFRGLSARLWDSIVRCVVPSLEWQREVRDCSAHQIVQDNIPMSGTGSYLLRWGGGTKIGTPHKPGELSGSAAIFPPRIYRRECKMRQRNGASGRSLHINAA